MRSKSGAPAVATPRPTRERATPERATPERATPERATPERGSPERPTRRRLLWLGAVAAAVILAATTPWWGRGLAFFRVQQVEVRGTRFARQSDIAARLGIDTTYSIWSSLDSLERRVQEHPQVQVARVSRRLPGTLVVTVDENLPIALVATAKGFRAYDDSARVLPLDPSRVPVDLPIVSRADPALFRLLGTIKAELPGLYARISEVRRVNKEEIVIQLVTVPVRARLDVSIEHFLELSSVEADLERRRLRPVELDLRFQDLVIARLP